MTYTTSNTTGAFHTVRIKPLDAAIVRFALTVMVPEYRIKFSDELLSLYSALALTKTKTKDKEAIETYLKRYGISLKVDAGRGSIQFQGNVRKDNVPEVLKLLREILTSLLIDDREFLLKKKLMLEENRESRDDAKRLVRVAFSNTLYDRENFMRDQTLDEELSSITKIKKQHLVDLIDALPYGEWFLTIVGTEEVEKQFDAIKKILVKKAKPVHHVVNEARVRESQSQFITLPGKTNVEVRVGNIIPITPEHPSYVALEFGLSVLGKVGGFSGRLMSTVREKEGLTYGIYARTIESHRKNTIHWNIYTFFTARDLQKGITSTLRELTSIVEKGITEEELRIFKEISLNQFILNHESNATRLGFYHGLSLLGYEEKDGVQFQEQLMKLTVHDVNTALRTYLEPDRLVIVGVGPVKEDGTGITT